MAEPVQAFLRGVPLLADLGDADLGHLGEILERRTSPPARIFVEGTIGDTAWLIRDGDVEIFKHSAGREVLLAVRGPGELIGELALLGDMPRMASARACSEAALLGLRRRDLEALVLGSPSAARTLFFTVLARWRATESMLHQSEKWPSSGLSAGLAHELNNPAAAAARRRAPR
jgi:CRP-like cAMP-binding protein